MVAGAVGDVDRTTGDGAGGGVQAAGGVQGVEPAGGGEWGGAWGNEAWGVRTCVN